MVGTVQLNVYLMNEQIKLTMGSVIFAELNSTISEQQRSGNRSN